MSAAVQFARFADPELRQPLRCVAGLPDGRFLTVAATTFHQRVELSAAHAHGYAMLGLTVAEARAVAAELLACADALAANVEG